ncbi:glycosyltransferase family 9 protein [Aeromonas caviae]|uniref:glycosyltransferase family 9 protein n=1 Tax=Aeromonas caviae TaxID=648 RepID=UPI0025B6F03F|nr:glycosyltransferase family 9 protein [Aeromonas caviae]
MHHLWFERGAYLSAKAKQYINNDFSPEKIKKIAVFRHAALGDQVIARPFLIEARKFFPNAKITLVGVSNYKYGAPSDLADETIFMAGKHDSKNFNWQQRLADFSQLEDQDIIFDLAATNRSYWMTLCSKAKLKFGFPYHSIFRGTIYNATVFRSDLQPELECMLDMLKVLGHNPSRPLDFGYPSHLELHDVQTTPTILYFNGASTTKKILSKEQMTSLLEQALLCFPEHRHIYLEGKNDFEKGDYLQHLTSHTNFSIQPCLPLNELTTFIAKVSLLVAPDTGIRNLAIATHTPTVGIFYNSTVPFRYTPLTGEHHIVINADGSIPNNLQIMAKIRTYFDI